MSSFNVPWKVRSALLALLTDDFVVQKCRRLPSRRNIVLHVTGTFRSTHRTVDVVAKWFKHSGIGHEAQVLRDAYTRKVPVPRVIGSTVHVLLLQFLRGENLCDLITYHPEERYGVLLGQWLGQYHEAFQRSSESETVLLKGDARIRNFIYDGSHLFGVDFEESYTGHYLRDLACTCASILDTDPLFTTEKLRLCRALLSTYSGARGISRQQKILEEVTPYLLDVLKETATRRRKPPVLMKWIDRFEAGAFHL